MTITLLVLRWMHILGAITLMGGAVFMRFALVPAAKTLADDAHAQLRAEVRKRWSKVVMLAITVLLVGGLANFFLINQQFKLEKPYHMFFGIKFLLALPIFFIASLLTGRTALADRVRQNATLWLNVNLVLATAVVCIGGFLKSVDRVPKPAADSVRMTTADSTSTGRP